jgi:uncharacterized protein
MKKGWYRKGPFFLICFFILGCQTSQIKDQICFKTRCVNVEIASSDKERMAGLQFRKFLLMDSGMLFVFQKKGRYNFWMKDTLIPLDMIWMDESRRIVHIEKNVLPCKNDPCPSYSPEQDAMYVLEINTGEAKRMELKEGDILEFRMSNFSRK